MVELVLCSTDAEAANLGLFLQHTLSLMAHWRVRNRPCIPKINWSRPACAFNEVAHLCSCCFSLWLYGQPRALVLAVGCSLIALVCKESQPMHQHAASSQEAHAGSSSGPARPVLRMG